MSGLVRDRLAELAHSIRYEDLPREVVHETARLILDTLGCALGGYRSAPASIARQVAHALGGNPEASTIGDEWRTSCALATLVNGTMMRYLDNNDYYFGRDSAHPSGNLAPALAVAQRTGRGGRDVITAMVVAYEIQIRLCDLAGQPSISERGWHPGTHMQFSSAALAARMLSDDPRVTAHALAIAGSHNNTLAQSQRGHIPMMKATAEAYIAKNGVEAALLAAAGLTGPEEIFEGVAGWAKAVAGEVDYAGLTAPCGGRFRILESCYKPYAAVAGAIAPIQAAIDLAAQGAIAPEDIESVVVKLHASAAKKASADPKKLYPEDKETADHSYHYCVAVALLDGACGPAQFTDARIRAPEVRRLIAKIRLAPDERLTALWPQSSGGGVIVTLRDGRELEKTHDFPPGHPRNRMSDGDIECKFFELSNGLLPRNRAQRVIDMTWKIANHVRLDDFMHQMILTN